MSVRRRVALPWLAAGLALSVPATAQEPTSEELWRRQPPPFQSHAEGLAAPTRAGAAMEMRLGLLPWLLPPLDPDPKRLAALETSASHIAARYASVGLRAPRITRRDGVYPIYYVRDLGSAAAQYGPGFGQFGVAEAMRLNEDDWDRVMIVGEADGFGSDLALFPEKVAVSVAHEIFHGIQASYANWNVHDNSHLHEEKWVTEALPDAIGLWATEGLSFMGNPPFDPRRRFASGSPRFGKVLGLRPYDYPLDLRTAPPRMPIFPAGTSADSRREMASYMSNSFWAYVWQHSMPRGQEWKPVRHALMVRTARAGTSGVREESLAWTDRSLRDQHPAWTRGLYDALPAFIPWWVAFPDTVMRSRKGEFAHTRWLGHAFVDGCPLYEFDQASPTTTVKVAVREMAATCIRVKWTGPSVGDSGWPAFAVVASPADGGGEAALTDLHLGIHGTNLGKTDPFLDPATGRPSLTWSGLSLDPGPAAKTDGETVITFTNVPPDPLRASRRTYDIHLGVGTSKVSGQLVKPAQSGKPASSVRIAPRPHVIPGQVKAVREGGTLSMAVVPASMAGKDDCMNATAKSAGQVAFGIDEDAGHGGASLLMAICLKAAGDASRQGAMPALKPDVELVLPAVPDGHTGPVAGGRVVAMWDDPGLGKPGDQHVDARTDDVDITIAVSNAAFVRGRFTARFSAPANSVNGELGGDFLVWRSPSDQRIALADPLDYVSSNLVQTFAAMGRDPAEIGRKMARRGAAQRGRSSARDSRDADVACTLDCESVRQGNVSPACQASMAEIYAACPEGTQVTREEIAALADWMFRSMPEPMRSEMTTGTVDTVMKMPSALREDWAAKLRAERAKAGD